MCAFWWKLVKFAWPRNEFYSLGSKEKFGS